MSVVVGTFLSSLSCESLLVRMLVPTWDAKGRKQRL